MEVAEYIGIPFSECNCAALVVRVMREKLGRNIPLHVSECADPLDGVEVSELIANEIKQRWKQVDTWREGDIVLFRMIAKRLHVGLMIGDEDKFLHSWAGSAASTPRLSDIAWRHRVIGFYRFND